MRNPPAGSSQNEFLDRDLESPYRHYTRNNNNNNNSDYAPVKKAYRKSRSVANLLNQFSSSPKILKGAASPNFKLKKRSNSAGNVLELDIRGSGSVYHLPLKNGKILSVSIHDNSDLASLCQAERHENIPDFPEDNYSAISDYSNVTSVSQAANRMIQPQLSLVREKSKDVTEEMEKETEVNGA